MRYIKIICLMIFVLFCNGCVRQKSDENLLKKNIGELLARYQQGVNNLDRPLLETIISEKFSFYEQGRSAYIDGLLTMTVLLDQIAYGNVRVNNYKIFADVQSEGSIIYKPDIQPPLFRNLPFMNGKLKNSAVFAFLYEEEGGLKILAEDQVLTEKEIVWGEHPPAIINPALSRYRVEPGDTVDVSFQIDKAQNDVMFVYVNDQLLGGYSALEESWAEKLEYLYKVPADKKRGESAEIKIQIFAGRVDLNNPQEAVLRGAAIRVYSLPVR